jgi:hypothetical protein
MPSHTPAFRHGSGRPPAAPALTARVPRLPE